MNQIYAELRHFKQIEKPNNMTSEVDYNAVNFSEDFKKNGFSFVEPEFSTLNNNS